MTKSYKETADNTVCKICGEEFQYLGSHLWHKHKIKSKMYKQRYGLDYNLPLMDEKTQEKKRIAFNQDREKYLKNLNPTNQFKKGEKKRTYFSKQSLINATKVIANVNEERIKENCPVCNLKFLHLDSHLFNKHKLLRAK